MNEDPQLLAKARRLAPKMDETSLRIFASSGLIEMLEERKPLRLKVAKFHPDCTGFYQRRRKE